MAYRQRSTAYKLWISQLHNGSYITTQDDSSNYLDINGLHVSRANIIATVTQVSKNEGYASLTLDDSSSSIRMKAWQQDVNLLAGFTPGDIVLAVGRVREYNSERYILPELVKKIENLNWLLVRKLELLKENPQPIVVKEERQNDEILHEDILDAPIKLSISFRQKILNLIESLDSAEGVSIEELATSSDMPRKELQLAIHELIKEGELYEHKQGKLKLLQ